MLRCESGVYRLLRNVEVCARLLELQTTMSAGVIQLKIPKRDSRVQVLQDQLDRGRRLVDARAKNMADVPGGRPQQPPCARQHELIEHVRQHLLRIRS